MCIHNCSFLVWVWFVVAHGSGPWRCDILVIRPDSLLHSQAWNCMCALNMFLHFVLQAVNFFQTLPKMYTLNPLPQRILSKQMLCETDITQCLTSDSARNQATSHYLPPRKKRFHAEHAWNQGRQIKTEFTGRIDGKQKPFQPITVNHRLHLVT